MKQALILIDEINRKKVAIQKTKSKSLIYEYSKSFKRDLKELKIYCMYKGLDFRKLEKEIVSI